MDELFQSFLRLTAVRALKVQGPYFEQSVMLLTTPGLLFPEDCDCGVPSTARRKDVCKPPGDYENILRSSVLRRPGDISSPTLERPRERPQHFRFGIPLKSGNSFFNAMTLTR